MKIFWLVIEWQTNWSYETPEPWARLLPSRSAPTFLRGDRRVLSKCAASFSWWKVFPAWIPTLLLWIRAAAGQGGLSSIPRLWSQFCQDCLLFLPGILNMREPVFNISVLGNSEHHNHQQTKYDGMGSLLCSLLHHALALLLCSLLCGQLEECETHLSQLQIYPWSLQGWSLGSGSHPTIFVRNFRVAIYSQQ